MTFSPFHPSTRQTARPEQSVTVASPQDQPDRRRRARESSAAGKSGSGIGCFRLFRWSPMELAAMPEPESAARHREWMRLDNEFWRARF
jgi:hypothetical protein